MTKDIQKGLIREFSDIHLIDNFLESLQDMNMLNSKGRKLRTDFWEKWIKE